MSMISPVLESLRLPRRKPEEMGALALAFVGDTVYDLFVRTMCVERSTSGAHALHMMSSSMVCAKAQAEAYHRMEPLLTEEEAAAFRRGRNAHSGTVPKNANVTDYRIATGVEALIGYLYCKGQDDRIQALMEAALIIPAEEQA